MKVLHILDSLNRGGAEMLELDVCRNANANDLDLIFVAAGGGDLAGDFENSGIEPIRLQRRLPLDPSLIKNLRKIIKTHNVEIVHAHQAVEGLHGYFACLGTKAKLVLTFHGYIPDGKNRLALKFLIPRVAANIAVSKQFLNWLSQKDGLDTTRNFHVVYNGVDEKRLASSGNSLRSELGLGQASLIFGMVGNFYAAPRKDQFTVCRALPAVLNRFPNAHFVFAGRAEENSDLEKCISFCRSHEIDDRVHFLGGRKDIADIWRALDVFVLSTQHEGLAISAIEAMLAKVPTILSDIAPLIEVSQNGEFAKIFKTSNAEDLVEKMIDLAEDEKLRKDLAARAYDFAKNTFSIEAHIAALKHLYERIASQ